ncbi:WYL domain-containing protein [Burkholderia sp. MSHR3999]|uniref:WYL domain-containing protein n=1 Tax=Burkholderia sp. MSHR3999 TaxID=1542965 RepID=UPI0005ACB738|nr:hypothetical protein [Burkholderia sp. MSHR3999]
MAVIVAIGNNAAPPSGGAIGMLLWAGFIYRITVIKRPPTVSVKPDQPASVPVSSPDVALLPEEDDFLAGDESIPVKATWRINYTDSLGTQSIREIDIRHYFPRGGYIRAYCHTAKASRTFRLDRINQAIDLETGEVLNGLRSTLRRTRTD